MILAFYPPISDAFKTTVLRHVSYLRPPSKPDSIDEVVACNFNVSAYIDCVQNFLVAGCDLRALNTDTNFKCEKMKPRKKLKPTLADVAAASGFSTATISRALRGDNAVTPDTRTAVLDVCAKLGYKPSIGGRILAQGASAFVGLSLGQTDNSTARYVSLLHQALSQQLTEIGWALRLVNSKDFNESLSEVGAMIIIGTVDHDPRIELCIKNSVPHVAIGYDKYNQGFSVLPDDDEGARLVARHFAKTGRKNMAIMPSRRDGDTEDISIRATACLDEGRRLNLSPKILPTINTITSTLDGYRSVIAALEDFKTIDCLFCETDEQALGAQAALVDSGFRVPEDIAIAGFDDLPELSAGLTTVKQDFSLLAATVLRLVEKARQGEQPTQVILPVELVVRASG
ncbi:MAG: hypothetical protein BA874_05740 [Desulfuromonadales bacterium C00003068]|nr:MAG: hypothetical protein BA874_05740 [Desulfuromonadales bacterium C00003068]